MSCASAGARSKREPWPLEELQRLLQGRVKFQADMKEFTTLKVGGPADAFVEPANPMEVERLVAWCRRNAVPFLVMGRGSNLLVRDGGIRGVVLRVHRLMGGFSAKESGKLVMVRVQAGCSVRRLLGEAVRRGWEGLHFLTGIPGNLGGAVAMNAGSREQGIESVVEALQWFDPQNGLVTRSRQDLNFGYRSLSLPEGSIILEVTLVVRSGRAEAVRESLRAQMAKRLATQPVGRPSAGSIFKNPRGDFAGRLIEKAGLKGFSLGGAAVSRQHANFILNTAGAKASDILLLMEEIQRRVLEHSGVHLEPEVRIVGEDG